ncbi:aldose 1-epimerase [Flavobacterium flevense]|uniref:Aldose 1-epimerase n=1 Tax=Flavobacterium flevense TaxID=983 RepID=A0A4Y4B026_9FLAO|nr:aldose epimerase family protein [Flavobacterium flevense]GEC72487.1 aldose 1-epimerase [Flavobacterium flevense]SHM13973.1 aldose 1-epimerase [Flavobacterium flevense]
MGITKHIFGTFQDKEVLQFTLTNTQGMSVSIMNYGATITAIKVPDKNGEVQEITCGFDTFEGYLSKPYQENSPYFGCTVGRYSSQIKEAKFSLNGKEYKLVQNCGSNNLHGGKEGFDKKIWELESLETLEASSSIKMVLESKHLEEGFPGNVVISIVFCLNDSNELSIVYTAIPDHDTPLSLTNHTYFNLSGFSESIENHHVQVNTNKRLQLDSSGAATGEIVLVEGQPDDLRVSKHIGSVHDAMNDGFEHFYIFDNPNEILKEVAVISLASNDQKITVSTTEPCMLLYTGKYTSGELARENGNQFGKFRGLCCETHRYPNGPNLKNAPNSLTKAGEKFKSVTIFKFDF